LLHLHSLLALLAFDLHSLQAFYICFTSCIQYSYSLRAFFASFLYLLYLHSRFTLLAFYTCIPFILFCQLSIIFICFLRAFYICIPCILYMYSLHSLHALLTIFTCFLYLLHLHYLLELHACILFASFPYFLYFLDSLFACFTCFTCIIYSHSVHSLPAFYICFTCILYLHCLHLTCIPCKRFRFALLAF